MPRPNTLAHTTPAHQSGHKHHSSSSPHPDTRGWGQTATPGASLHTAKTGATKPTTVATLAFIPLPYTSPAGVLARQRSGSAQGLGGTPGVEKMGEPAAESLLPSAPDPLHRQVSL